MTVKDVAYNAIDSGAGHAAVAIYFSNQAGLCDAESRMERRPGEVVAVALLEGESPSHLLAADTYLVQPTDPRVDVTLDSYDSNCMLAPGGDGASSGSIAVEAAASDSSLPLTASLTFAEHGQSLAGKFSAAFCPSIVDRSGSGYHCP